MKRVDLNVDIGEGFPHDEALLEFATSANICCGEHAGSWELSKETIDMCLRKGIRIGCHPGFPDREHFGRRIPSDSELLEYLRSMKQQVDAFKKVAPPIYIKPHGALYNILCSRDLARDGIPKTVFDICTMTFSMQWMLDRNDTSYMLLRGTQVNGMYNFSKVVKMIGEGFADRRYRDDGTLLSRSAPGAVLDDPDEIRKQVLEIAPKVDSICLHGDTPHCLEFAELVHKTLFDAGYGVGY